MTTCIVWIVYSFNLVPGMLSIKLSLYFIITSILVLLGQPKGYGLASILCHAIAYIVQIYLKWQKYHEDCQILNKVYEKNISEYLQTHFPEAVFTLDNKLNAMKTNEQGIKLLQLNNVSYFKDLAISLVNDKNETLYNDILKLKEIENIQYSSKLNRDLNQNDQKEIYRFVASSSCFEIDNNIITILIIKDFTEFFRLQENNILERFQNILLYSVPHEIRSQLNLISGNLEQLDKKFERSVLKLAKSAAKVMEYKLNLLFDFASLLSGKFKEHTKHFDFKSLVEESSEIINEFAKAKNIPLSIKYQSNNSKIVSDFERFFSIMIHCGLNSVKYTTEGSVGLSIKNKNNFLCGKISDTGKGMKAPIVHYINQYSSNPFAENSNILKNSLNDLENSKFLTGIGSLASSLICNKLKGSFFITSRENQGTVIKFKIQSSPINELIEDIYDESCVPDSGRLSIASQILKYQKYSTFDQLQLNLNERKKCFKLKIIVVDDLAFNRITLTQMLKSLGFTDISESENGQEAVTCCLESMKKYDLISIFMDIDMPVMDGILATSKIKAIDKEGIVNIAMLSAFDNEELISSSFQVGAIAFYVKPISFKKLKELKDSKFFG